MDIREIEQLKPVEGERIPESQSWLWAGVGVSILALLSGGALVWAWWTKFPLYETEEVRVITPSDNWRPPGRGAKSPEKDFSESQSPPITPWQPTTNLSTLTWPPGALEYHPPRANGPI